MRVVAEAALPTRFGKFTILGVEGNKPERQRSCYAMAIFAGADRRWCAFTRNALPGMFSLRKDAIAARNWSCH